MFEESQKNLRFYPLILSLSATLFLTLSWYVSAFFVFVAFIPLLELENYFQKKNPKRDFLHYFLYLYLNFWLWNVAVVFWLTGIEFWAGILVFFLNALFMTIPFLLFRLSKKYFGKTYAYFLFILLWLSFEYIHHHWFLAFPWLSLGNVFGTTIFWIQWYEFTGVLGGTLWALLMNVCIFIAWREVNWKYHRLYWFVVFITFLLPSIISWCLWEVHQDESPQKVEIVVVQPNFHPTQQKLKTGKRFVKFEQQIALVHELAQQQLSDTTDLLLLPESALDDFFERNLISIGQQYMVNNLTNILEKYPKLSLLTGLTTFSYVDKNTPPPYSARYSKQMDVFYTVYNSAVFFQQEQKPQFYSKSKLVAGGEYMPLKWLIGNWAINAGGTSGEVTPQEERTIFQSQKSIRYAPIVCYESVFGEFVSEYSEKRATILCVVTNDGYWDGTPEPMQHFHIDRLRCVEQRKPMARAAYTGISGFINHRGEIIEASQNQERIVLKASLSPMAKKTFYQQNGDYLGRIATILILVLLVVSILQKILRRN